MISMHILVRVLNVPWIYGSPPHWGLRMILKTGAKKEKHLAEGREDKQQGNRRTECREPSSVGLERSNSTP